MRRATAGLLLALALAVGQAAPAHAEAWLPPLPEAKPLSERDKAAVTRAYQGASRAFARRRYQEALVHADRAFVRLPNASTALVRATILEKLARPEDAFVAFLAAADLDPTPDERALIDAGLATHGATLNVGWVEVNVTPEDTTVFVDGTAFSGHRTVGLPAGRHELILERADFAPLRPTVAIHAGAGTALETVLERVVAPGPGGGPDPGRAGGPGDAGGTLRGDDAPGGDTLAGWLLAGGGLAAVLAGVGTHLAAADAADEADGWAHPGSDLDTDARRARYDDAVSKKDTLETVSWVMYGVGAAALITGVILLVDDDAPPAAPALTFSPTRGGAGVALHTTF